MYSVYDLMNILLGLGHCDRINNAAPIGIKDNMSY